jgi:hypothetical protein
MEIKLTILYIVLVLMVIASQIFDVLGYKFRCNKDKTSLPNTTAIAGILFYISRLGFMLYVMILAMLHEILKIDLFTLNAISIIGMTVVVVYVYVMKSNNILSNIIFYAVNKFGIFKQKNISINIEYNFFKNLKLDKKLFLYSLLVNFFVLFCGLFPVNLIKIYPNIGMSLVYFSNAISAIAGLSWYLLQEPRIVDKINASKHEECYKSLIFGKISSLLATIACLLIFMQYVK